MIIEISFGFSERRKLLLFYARRAREIEAYPGVYYGAVKSYLKFIKKCLELQEVLCYQCEQIIKPGPGLSAKTHDNRTKGRGLRYHTHCVNYY